MSILQHLLVVHLVCKVLHPGAYGLQVFDHHQNVSISNKHFYRYLSESSVAQHSRYVEGEPELPSWLESKVKDHVQDLIATIDPTFVDNAELQTLVLAQIENFMDKLPSQVEEADEPTARKYCAPRKAVCKTPDDCCDKTNRCAYPNYGIGVWLDSEFFGKSKICSWRL
uniref:U11-Austrotoxin-Ht1a_1 n=1 Tax=Hickmania troglodytes TaxID=489260 RepID=A0A482ZGB4_9ARAC